MKTIKFISLNIWEGGKLFTNVVNFLKEEKADIVALQEVCNSDNQALAPRFRSYQELKAIIGYQYSVFAPMLLDVRSEGKIPWGNAVFSNFKITSSQGFFYDIPFGEVELSKMNDFTFTPRLLQQVDLKVCKTNFSIFNNHGIWGTDGKDNPRRLAMGKLIVDKIKDKPKVILAGDFNLFPNTQTVKNIEQHLKSVFGNKLETTFNVKRKNDERWGKFVVDMAFVSPGIKVVDHWCPKADISDHLPLVCVLGIDS